jgi:small subunit ribosomal protein S19e
MTTAYDVPPELLIERVAERLKKEEKLAPPDWAAFVRTGRQAEKSPVQADWWYVRAAAVLRKVYIMGPIGSSRLAAEYGGKADHGSAPFHPVRGSRNVARQLLKQLEAVGYVQRAEKKGRVVSPKGRSFLDNLSFEIMKELAAKDPERFGKFAKGG